VRGTPLSTRSYRLPRESNVTDFQLVLRTVTIIFLTCAVLAVLVVVLEAFVRVPGAEFLVRKFGDILMLCVGAIVGLLAGHQIKRRHRGKHQRSVE